MPPEWECLRAAEPRLALLYDLICFYHPLPICSSCRSTAYFPSTASPYNAASAAMPHSARSLPPSKRHTRLTIVRRGCWMCRIAGIHGEAMYTAPDSAGRAALQAPDLQCRGSRGTPLVLSLGGVRGIFSFREREYPPLPRPHTLWGQKQPPRAAFNTSYCSTTKSHKK